VAKLATVLSPRKRPKQSRSTFTVEAIFDATIQVLLHEGSARLNTTRVANRAGVSVGTLYQYFPNKDALLAAVLERHLLVVVNAVENACSRAKGRLTAELVREVVNAFFEAKFSSPETSRALYELSSSLGGAEMVMRMTQRSQLALCEALAVAPDHRSKQLSTVSYVFLTALIGPVQGLLTSNATAATIAAVQANVLTLLAAYLERASDGVPM
jgi:AcrR family transcriptional regulator